MKQKRHRIGLKPPSTPVPETFWYTDRMEDEPALMMLRSPLVWLIEVRTGYVKMGHSSHICRFTDRPVAAATGNLRMMRLTAQQMERDMFLEFFYQPDDETVSEMIGLEMLAYDPE